MLSENDIISNNINNNTEKQSFEEFQKKLDSIETQSELQSKNYSSKLVTKFPFLKDFIKIPEENKTQNTKITKTKNQKIAIIYHHPCFDGSYSAINAYLYYIYFSSKANKIDFFPMTNSQRLEEKFDSEMIREYEKIYLFDKGFNQEDFQNLYEMLILNNENTKSKENASNATIIIVDHHISSIEVYYNEFFEKFKDYRNITFVFDREEKRSACGITYEFFNAKALRKMKSLMNNKANELFNEKYESYCKFFSEEYRRVKIKRRFYFPFLFYFKKLQNKCLMFFQFDLN